MSVLEAAVALRGTVRFERPYFINQSPSRNRLSSMRCVHSSKSSWSKWILILPASPPPQILPLGRHSNLLVVSFQEE
jgi:hypothetical protein